VDGFKVQPYLLGGGDLSGSDNQWLGGTIRFAGRSGLRVEGASQKIIGVTVEDCGWNWCSEGGIHFHECDNCLLSKCNVKRMARMGISLMTVAHCQILNNFVEDVCLYSNDIGDLDSWGTDGQGTEIAYNTFGRNQGIWGAGLYLDDNSKNFYAHDNLIKEQAWNGIIFKAVNRIEHNTVLDAGHQGILIYPPAKASLKGGVLAHNQVPENYPIRVNLSSSSVSDYGNYGSYAYLTKPGRVEMDWNQLDQQAWAKQIPMDLTKVDSVGFSEEQPAAFQYSIANLRFLPIGKTGDEGAVTVTGATWAVYSNNGSTAKLNLSGPVTWGTSGTNVLFGWNTLRATLAGGSTDLTGYRGMAFEIEGKAERTYAIQGLTETDNGPETVKGRGVENQF
jgi:hypothetical protein